MVAATTVLAMAVSGVAYAALADRQHAGPQGDGTAYTPTGWHVTPAGRQVTLGERPYGLALSPDGRHALVSNDGVGIQSVQLVDVNTGTVSSEIDYPAPEAVYLGVAWASDGRRAYVSGGQNDQVRVYDVTGGKLAERAPLTLSTQGTATVSFAAGLALSKDDKTLYVADHLGNAVSVLDVATGHETRIPLSGTACTLNAFGSDPSNGTACEFAYGVVLSPDGGTAYVSSWGKDYISTIDTHTARLTGRLKVGVHPSAMLVNAARGELYVANTESDSISVLDLTSGAALRTVSLSPFAGAQPGTQPNALATSPDGQTLYVANAGNNDVDVVRLGRRRGGDRVLGLIPTAWYPTGVAVTPDGGRLVVANGKGLGAGPNPGGPNTIDQYIGSMIKGTMSIIKTPNRERLAGYTRQVQANGGFGDLARTAAVRQHVVPVTASGDGRQHGPIKHVIYVVNENRTYDQVLGDLGKGNGDPSLALFGKTVTPNHHALASRFATLDNLFAAGEVSDDGWEWTVGGNAATLDVKTQPTLYGGRGHFYIGEGGSLGAAPSPDPKNAYIWGRLDRARLSYRNFGFWATDTPPVDIYNEPTLNANTNHDYAGFNMNIPDQSRFDVWLKEFEGYRKAGRMPTAQFIKFPRDHTAGTSPGANTPRAMVADSDYALGKLVDTVSHSAFWKDTAIFVIEDDAQDGPDHVDAHRVLAQVISPYTQTGRVDSTFYSSMSMLRTMELILGVKPMTQFDAAATPLIDSFTDRPNFAPFTAQKPQVDLNEVNPPNAPLAAQSAAMDFTREDRAPRAVLNQAIWQSVKGAGSRMPAPHNGLAGPIGH
jgi:YVTN family beta-propeller protein